MCGNCVGLFLILFVPYFNIFINGDEGMAIDRCFRIHVEGDLQLADNTTCAFKDKKVDLFFQHKTQLVPTKFDVYPFSIKSLWSSFVPQFNNSRPEYLRYRHLIDKADKCDQSRGQLNLYVLGGSVTAGESCCELCKNPKDVKENMRCSVWGRFENWLRKEYRSCNIYVWNRAVHGTHSAYASLTFKPINNADAIFIDYAVNDIGSHGHKFYNTTTDMSLYAVRVGLESLLRRCLRSKGYPVVFFYVTFLENCLSDSWYQDKILTPLSSHYNVPIISFRDTCRQFIRDDDINGNASTEYIWNEVHPDYQTHQLMADVLSFSWSVIKNGNFKLHLTDDFNISNPVRSMIPKMLFDSDTADNQCDANGGIRTDYNVTAEGVNYFVARVYPSEGWYFVKNGSKSGWEYNSMNDIGKNLSVMPVLKLDVSFNMSRPVLMLTAMASYNTFTDGKFYFNYDDKMRMIQTSQIMETIESACSHINKDLKHARKEGKRENTCHGLKLGSFYTPHTIKGSWEHHYSMPHTSLFTNDYTLMRESDRVGYVPKENHIPLPVTNETINNKVVDDLVTVTIAVIAKPPKNNDEAKARHKFRLMGIRTC